MEPIEPNKDQFARIATTIAVDDPADALRSVQQKVTRGRTRRRAVAGVFASAVVVGGGVFVIDAVRDDGDDSLTIGDVPVTTLAPETTVATGQVPSDGDAGDGDAGAADRAPVEEDPAPAGEPQQETGSDADVQAPPTAVVAGPTLVELVDASPTLLDRAANDSIPDGFVDWIVPWADGFLAGRSFQEPQALPELPDEVVALFPPEVVDFFGGELPSTIDAAIAQLTEAGLLDEVTAVLSEHPEVNDLIFSVPTEAPELAAYFSTDGSSWERVPMSRPVGAEFFQAVQSTGDRLVVMSQTISRSDPFDSVGAGDIVVASTTDLTNWEVSDIPASEPLPGLADAFRVDFFPQSLAVSDDGWVLDVLVNNMVDVRSILPDEFQDDVESGSGFSVRYRATGVDVTIQGPFVETRNADGEVVGGEPQWSQELSFTWEELGVPESAAELISRGGTNEFWAARWGDEPVRPEGPTPFQVTGSSDGFYGRSDALDFSPDGITWTSLELPDNAFGVTALMPIEEGVIAVVNSSDGGSDVYRVNGAAGTFELLEVPGMPDQFRSNVGGPSAGSPSVLLVDAAVLPVQPPTSVTVEHEGYSLTVTQGGPTVSVTLVDPDGEIAVDLAGNVNDQNPSVLDWTTDEIKVLDPDSGEVIVAIPAALMEAAYAAQVAVPREGVPLDEPHQPDLWLLATIDGDRWLVEDLAFDASTSSFGSQRAVANGDVVLFTSGTDWTSYDLG